MANTKRFKVDFYKVSLTDSNNRSFDELIDWIFRSNDKTKVVKGVPVYIYQTQNDSNFWQGEMIRVRLIDPPSKASINGHVEEIPLNDDEGIGERAAFLFHKDTRILLLQRTHSGVSISAMANYFGQFINNPQNICMDPVLNQDAEQKLASIDAIQKFQIHVAGLDKMPTNSTEDYAIDELLDIYQRFGSPYVSLTLSMAHLKGNSINKANILSSARKWIGITQNSAQEAQRTRQRGRRATMLRINGVDSEGSGVYIDLLKNRMTEAVNVNLQGGRTISYNERTNALKQAWSNRETSLLAMFGSN